MTREEILPMEPGLELDMLVGQYVIGFEDYLKEFGRRPVVRDGRYGKNYFDLPSYSSDISAAWEVVDGIDGKYAFEIGRPGDYFAPDDKWKARFGMSGWVEAETAPEAICKAALLAVMDA